MASQVPPKKNTAFNLGLTLYKNDGTLIANPGTLTAKISKDFGDYADIGTTSEEDSTYGQIKLALTATEMNADVVMIYVVDNTSGCVPFTATIYTAANLMDDIKTDTAAILADTGTDGVVLAADAITAAKIADDAFSSEHFATGAFTADAFAADAIVAATLATGALTADAFAADAIVAATLATGALTADAFAANAITNAAVADDVDVNVKTITAGAITATAIANDAIDLATFAADCKTGSALKANVETISANAITAAAINADAITEAKIADAALSTEHFNAAFYTRLGIVAYGTAQAATSTTLQLAAASAFADDELNGAVVVITGGTGVGQSRVITNYTGSTDTAEVDAWTTTPSGTITYVVFAAAPASATSLPAVNVTQLQGSAAAAANMQDMFDGTGYAGGAIQLNTRVATVATDAIDAAAIKADAVTKIQTGLATPTNITAGTITTVASVTGIGPGGIASTSFQSGAITASAIATGAIDADALATDAVDEIVDGVWNEGVSTHSTPNTYGVLAGLVWEEASSSHATVGTLGRELNDASDNSAAILADTGTDGVVVASIATGAIDSDALDSTAVVEITTATWNESLASHTTPGTAGKTLTDLIEDTGTTLDALVKDIPTVSEFNARTLAAADYVVVSDTLAGVTSVTSVAAGGITASSIATGAIDADALSADAVAEIADGVWDESLMGHVVAGTAGKGLGDTTYAATLAGVVVSSVSAGAAAAIADGILDRDMSTGSDSGSATVRTVRQALRFLRNKWEIVTGTLTVYKENDSTASWTSTVGSTSGADPVTSNDPASS